MAKTKGNIVFRKWDELKVLRDRRLYLFITRQLYPFSPYYRRLFDKHKIDPKSIKTVDDLEKIPFTSKDDFFEPSDKGPRIRNLDFVLQPNKELMRRCLPKAGLAKLIITTALKGRKFVDDRMEEEYRPVFLTATTGTTKDPVPFLYTNYDIENLKLYGERIIDIFGIKKDQRAVNIFPYAPHLAFWQTVFAGLSSNIFILSTGGGKTLGTDGNIRSILRAKPHFLIGVPNYVYHILKTARDENLNFGFLNKIALGASRVPKGFKKKISKLLEEMGSREVTVGGTYGFTEARAAWAECPTGIDISSGYHTYPDKEVFEVIDPETGKVRGEGEDGELVYTAIDARGSCVLRYRTGDLVKGGITYSPCPYCGRTVPRISSDIVRASNVKNFKLTKIKGALIDLNNLERLLDDKEVIDEWQVEIRKKDNDPYEVDEFILHVSLLSDVNKTEFAEKLNREVFSSAEISFNKINFVTREEISGKIEIESAVKAKRIVDKRPAE